MIIMMKKSHNDHNNNNKNSHHEKKKIKTVNIMINIINFWLWKFMLYITEVKYAKYP